MTLHDVKRLLNATVDCCEENLGEKVHGVCGADLMSDVLAFGEERGILLTGLINLQVVRTAEMLDVKAVIFIRGKSPTEEIISLAREKGLTVMHTKLPMFPACGVLYQHGLEDGDA